jgi:DNA sulfur modification protein DndD
VKLESIRVSNFRQFYGDQDAQFSGLKDRNVTVFHGKNGAGKTSLFSAVNWCLYGAGVEDIGEIVNKRALAEAAEGDLVMCRVMIWFMHESNRYVASRFLRVRRARQRGVSVGTEFRLTRVLASGDHQEVSNSEGLMNAILPANVRPYFFFDGEKMDDLTKAGNKEVEDAVRNVMRFLALDRAETHLKDIAANYRRQIKKQGSPELERLISNEERLRSEKDQALRRLDELREEIRLARQHIDELDQRLRGSELTHGLQQQRDRDQKALTRYEEQERRVLRNIQKAVNRSYAAFMNEPVRRALAILDEKRERGEIPSGVREQLVKDLLDNLTCICGRPFHEGDEAYNELASLADRATSSRLESEVLTLSGVLRALPDRVEEQRSALNEQMQERQQIKDLIEQLYGEIDDVNRQLLSAPEEEIAGLERQRSKFRRNLEVALGDQGTYQERIKQIDGQLEGMIKKKQEAEEKEKKLTLLGRKEELAQKAADAVTTIKAQFSEQTRQEIEAWTRNVFSRLAWKQEHFQDVRLDQDFRLEVIDRWGTPTREELSAGERQILSLSFICAMAKVSGEDAPLVMDTPFGRLSGDHLSAVAENLPQLTSQLVLFVTDREWDEASRTNLEPNTGAQYELNFDSRTGCTEIRELSYR